MKICLRNTCRRVRESLACSVLALLFAGGAPAATAPPVATASPSARATAAPQLSLGGVVVGASVLDAVKRYGAPDIVRTTDLGHEWQWLDTGGLDREVLTDDDMVVRQVLIAEPAPIAGESPAPTVQPAEFHALAVSVDEAANVFAAAGGTAIAEPDPAIRAWSFSGGVLVAELDNGVTGRLTALDDIMARRLGYLQPPPDIRPSVYHAPVLTRDFVVPYPRAPLGDNVEGVAVVRTTIDPMGAPKDVRIVVTSGNADLDAAAVEAVRKSAFRPARCDNAPCPGVFYEVQEFTIFH
jgi:TonB family protein